MLGHLLSVNGISCFRMRWSMVSPLLLALVTLASRSGAPRVPNGPQADHGHDPDVHSNVAQTIDPDVYLNVTQIIPRWGYPVENYEVITPDGYILREYKLLFTALS